MIRPIRAEDIPKLRELEDGFEWEFREDFIDALVYVDENDTPKAFIGAWKRAETHVAVDKNFSTPGARFLLLNDLQEHMQRTLKADGFVEMVTWFDPVKDRFIERMRKSGWIMSIKQSWHRRTT